MASGRIGVEIANLDVMCNGMTGRPDVGNRFLFQWAHPLRQDDNPFTSFAVASLDGPVPAPDLGAAVPGSELFEGQRYKRLPGEALTLEVHHSLDMHRDFLQKALGMLIEDLAGLAVGGVSVGPISLGRLLDARAALKLSEDVYSLPIGHHSLAIGPATLGAGGAAFAFATSAPADVFAFGRLGPSGPPPRVKVVSAGANTARMTLVVKPA